jgi:hypothetical protein
MTPRLTLLAIVLLSPPALALPATPEEACNDHDLQVMMSSTPDKRPGHMQELDQRFAFVLHEERAAEAGLADAGTHWAMDRGLPAGLTLLGLVLILIAVSRKSRALALLGVVALLAGSGVALRTFQRDAALRARALDLKDCRFHIYEARFTLEHGELARALHDITEADEDLMGFEGKIKMGGKVELPEVQKLRGELSHR